MEEKKAVVLLSGGLDSAVSLYVAKSRGYSCNCLSFSYDQRHIKELEGAKRLTKLCGCQHTLLRLDIPWLKSALTDKNVDLSAKAEDIGKKIPHTYVSGRNLFFLSLGISYCESIGALALFIGANAVDFSGYPDCRDEFLDAFQDAAALGTKAGVRGSSISIERPLIDMTKSDIIRLGIELGVPFELTWSCYVGGEKPCGKCESCLIREGGFRDAGISDPSIKAMIEKGV